MNKIVRIGLIVLGSIIILAVVFTTVFRAVYPKVPEAPKIHIEASPERIERGKYLTTAVMGCVDCHAQRDYTKFTAPVIPGTEGAGGEKWTPEVNFPGTLYAPNITPVGIGDWSDGEIYRAITMGVDKDGNALFPIMPYKHYGKMKDEDIYSVIAYIKTLEPVQNTVPERELDFPLSFLVHTMPEVQVKIPKPHISEDAIGYGRYITNAAACSDCHTPEKNGQYILSQYMAGGFEFPMPNGTTCRSANLTPHKKTGIGNWRVEDFVARFNKHRNRALCDRKLTEGEFNSIMPWEYYSNMSNQDLAAIYYYLQSLAPIENDVEIFVTQEELASR